MLELETLRQQNQTLLNQLQQRQNKLHLILNGKYITCTDTALTDSAFSCNHRTVPFSVDQSQKYNSVDVNGLLHSNGGDVNIDTQPQSTVGKPTSTCGMYLSPRKHLASVAKSAKPVKDNHSAKHVDSSLVSYQDTDRNNINNANLKSGSSQCIQSDTFSTQSSDNRTLTSTPKKSVNPQPATPRSVLKRRKIIDDNVHVESKYPHTPSIKSPKRVTLNFSYSNVDDEMDRQRLHSLNMLKQTVDSTDLDGSYLEEFTSRPSSHVVEKVSTITENGKGQNYDSLSGEIEELLQKRLLLDAGNDRKNVSVVEELDKRPTNVLFESKVPESILNNSQKRKKVHKLDKSVRFMDQVILNTMDLQKSESKTSPLRREQEKTHNASLSKLWRSRSEHPLLGYDWIAGLLDNETSVVDKSEAYFDEIKEFRRVCKEDCYGKYLFDKTFEVDHPISPEVKDPGHTCIHGFMVNERLFTEPINADEEGRSVCPVCLSTRNDPSRESPGFVRVSIPRSTIESPYKIKPHRRRSFDPTDSVALSKHCLAGWETSRPAMLPMAATVDLKDTVNGVKAKHSTTMEGANREAKSYSQVAKSTLTSGQTTQDLLNSSLSRTTDGLLNTSHALRYDLQLLERKRGLSRNNPPASTAYPLL